MESNQLSRDEVVNRLHHLAESVGAKLRSQGRLARGVEVYAKSNSCYWHKKHLSPLPFDSDIDIWRITSQIFSTFLIDDIREVGISCYRLQLDADDQISLFDSEIDRARQATSAIDTINHRWGERTIHSAGTLGTDIYIKNKVPFGSTRFL